MIGGTIHFAQSRPTPDTMRRERVRKSPRTEKLLELVKFYGKIELRDLASLMGITCEIARSTVEHATLVEGSRIYDEKIKGVTVIGWME